MLANCFCKYCNIQYYTYETYKEHLNTYVHIVKTQSFIKKIKNFFS